MADETDFFAWTQEQAAALRRMNDKVTDLPGVDLEELAGEIEDVGNDIRSEVEGLVIGIVAKLIKLHQLAPEADRVAWMADVRVRRLGIAKRARGAGSVLRHMDLAKIHQNATTLVELESGPLANRVPMLSLDQILAEDWWPEVHS